MKNVILTIALLIMIFAGISAQDIHFSQLTASLFYTNPSSVLVLSNPAAGIIYRNQWPALQSAYVTYGALYVHPVEPLKSTFGFVLLHDIQGDGIITKTIPAGTYCYSIQLNKTVTLGAGIGLSYVIKKMNPDRLEFETDIIQGDNYSYMGDQKLSNGYFDFSFGLSATAGNNFVSGISVHHLTKPDESLGQQGERLDFLMGFYSQAILELSEGYGQKIAFKPGIQFLTQGMYNELLYGTSFLIEPFELGLWARNDIRFNMDALILSFGFNRNAYTFSYSFDVNLKKMKFFSVGMGAHEVTFLYHFKYKEKRYRYNK